MTRLLCEIVHILTCSVVLCIRQVISSFLKITIICKKNAISDIFIQPFTENLFRKVAQNRKTQKRNSEIKFANDCRKYYFFVQKCSATKAKICVFFLKNVNPTWRVFYKGEKQILFPCTLKEKAMLSNDDLWSITGYKIRFSYNNT